MEEVKGTRKFRTSWHSALWYKKHCSSKAGMRARGARMCMDTDVVPSASLTMDQKNLKVSMMIAQAKVPIGKLWRPQVRGALILQ